MILGMCIYPIGDAATKFLGDAYSPIVLAWIRFLIGASVLAPIATLSTTRQPIVFSPHIIKEQLIRSLCILSATLCFVAAIIRIPLADAFGAYMIGPIIAMILAVIVLKESLTLRKVLALLMGFIGAIIIIKPGVNMNAGYLFALGAGISFGAYLVANRWAASSIPPLIAVAFQTCFGAIVLAPFAWQSLGQAQNEHIWLFATIGLGSALANLITIFAAKFADASSLAPLVYVEVVAATALGYWVFNDLPSARVWLGIAIIVAAGLSLINRPKTAFKVNL